MVDDTVLLQDDQAYVVNDAGDDFDIDNPDNYNDIDQMMEFAKGEAPDPLDE